MNPLLIEFLSSVKCEVDTRLPELLHPPGRDSSIDPVDHLPAAARDALLSPGKRVRPALVFLCGELFRTPRNRLLDPACAIEMVHAASLVLDDLPSMDDATLRRGRPTLHLVHGEDMAILSAVSLLTRAFGLLADAGLHQGRGSGSLPAASCLDLISRLSEACGLEGLSSGQALDLRVTPGSATFERLETVHARKTGALFVASAEFGAVLGGAREKELAAVRSYAKNIGLAFQIVDDLLETEPSQETGKASKRSPVPSFTRHLGAEGARLLVSELSAHAIDALSIFGSRAAQLGEFAAYLRDRRA